jgi:hypothetical protein
MLPISIYLGPTGQVSILVILLQILLLGVMIAWAQAMHLLCLFLLLILMLHGEDCKIGSG